MFGRKRGDSEQPKRRWFFKIENLDDANEALKIGYQTYFVMAAIMAVIICFVVYLGRTGWVNLIDCILLVVIGYLLRNRKSRTASVVGILYAGIIFATTLSARFGIQIDGLGGKNIILAILLVYGAYMGMKGAFAHHTYSQSRVLWKRVWFRTAATTLYLVVVLVAVLVGMSVSPYEQFLFAENSTDGEQVLGLILVGIIGIITVTGGLGILPGTKSKIIEYPTTVSNN